MKVRKPPILTAKDLANIRIIVQQECLSSNREVRKKIAKLEKQNQINEAYVEDATNVIKSLRAELLSQQEKQGHQSSGSQTG